MLASPALASPPQRLSGPSPFASCKPARGEGTNFLNAEVEPWVAAHPSNAAQLVAGWQQDRWSNGGSRSLLSAYSADGGGRWIRVVVPGINKCSGGTGDFAYDRSSDPWTAISPDGTSYFMSLSFTNDRPDGGGGINAMLVNRSSDGGATWSPPLVLRRDTDGRIFNDKNSITADPTDSNYVYATWDQLFDTSLPQARAEAAKAAQAAGTEPAYPDGVLMARDRLRAKRAAGGRSLAPAGADYYTGPAYFVRTTDGGLTAEPAKIIHDPGINAQTIGNQVVVRANGDVLMFFTEIFADGSTKLRFVKSSDHGASFGPAVDAVVTQVTSTGTRTPDRQAPVRDANVLFDVATDPATGNLYLVWQDGRDGGVDKVAFSMSTDGGASWSPPAIISKTPANPNALRTQSFVPSVEVAADSRVVVTYYDFRNDRPRSRTIESTDYWAISCRPGTASCTTANGWGNELRLTAKSFNMLNAPVARGYFLGDYQGLVKQGTGVRSVFAIATTRRQTEIVTSLIP